MSTVLIAVVGWWVGHYLSSKRDAHQKLVNIRTELLLKTYQRLQQSSAFVTRQTLDSLETALSDLQLLGNAQQVKLAVKLSHKLSGNHVGSINIGDVLKSLRDSLRSDLGLEQIEGEIVSLRLTLIENQESGTDFDLPGPLNEDREIAP